MFQDKNLACRDCSAQFTFSASEQEFYAEKGFTNEPSRCPQCRSDRKRNSNSGGGFKRGGDRPQREMFAAVCAECGTDTKVPFQPSGEKPVYCRDCFTQNKR